MSGRMTDFIPLTPQNFEEQKKKIIKIIEDLKINDLDSNFEMSFAQGVLMGNHANGCDSCNIFHYLMAHVIDNHRLVVGK